MKATLQFVTIVRNQGIWPGIVLNLNVSTAKNSAILQRIACRQRVFCAADVVTKIILVEIALLQWNK